MTIRLSPAIPLRLRVLAIGGLALASLAASEPGSAQLTSGYNNNAPVNYSADRIEIQDRDNRVVLSGNVDVTQDTLRLRAARVTVSYTNNGSLKIQRMIANGGVYVVRGTENARGDSGVYDLIQRVITLSGHVTLDRSGDKLSGGRAVMNLATGISSVDSTPANAAPGKGGRVSGTFSVAKGK
jgi:lipopolysaccharide export system protein LptA